MNHSSFDFPKTRKKWAEILITELSDVLVMILSPSAKPLFCSPSVFELIGWKDQEILAMPNIREIIHHEDILHFFTEFNKSLRSRSELLTYVRLNFKPPQLPPLTYPAHNRHVQCYEFKGSPHSSEGSDPDCYFIMATPSPSRNQALLDSFLDLRVEHARLQQRVEILRTQVASLPPKDRRAIPLRIYTGNPSPIPSPHRLFYPAHSLPTSALSTTPQDLYGLESTTSYHPTSSDDIESDIIHQQDGNPRKRRKLVPAGHRVCSDCGRTDSPEWRKGPLGPKTLCNACGLRYAKLSKRKDIA